MKKLLLILAVVVTWDSIKSDYKKESIFDPYAGYVRKELVDHRKILHMKKTFHSLEEAREFLNNAPDDNLPIFGHDLKYQKQRPDVHIFAELALDNWRVTIDGREVYKSL